MTSEDAIRMAREAGSIDSEEVIETVYAAFAAAERDARPSCEELGYVPLSEDGRSVFIDGVGLVPLAQAEPVAWMRDAGEPSLSTMAYCIPETVRQVWLKANPTQVERYTIPLYAAPPAVQQAEPVRTRAEAMQGMVATSERAGLYELTAEPVERKPLTEEEIAALLEKCIGSLPVAKQLIRAVEAAHGIKEAE